jgi:hypothetical protein
MTFIDPIMTDIESAKILREIEDKMRRQQLGEAWIGIPTGPLLTAIVPDGMDSPLRKAVRK